MKQLTNLANLILTHQAGRAMSAFVKEINTRAGKEVANVNSLYAYTSGHRRPDPKQLGQLARHMATNAHERAEILAAYLEDTLDATDIPPSERGLQIVLAVTEALAEEPASYTAGHDRPDRERDLAKLADHWHEDADLRQLLHSLANMLDPTT